MQMSRTEKVREIWEAGSIPYRKVWNGRDVCNWAGRAMRLTEFGLVWLQHPNLAPPIEEEGDGTHPEQEHDQDDPNFLPPHNHCGMGRFRRACLNNLQMGMRWEQVPVT